MAGRRSPAPAPRLDAAWIAVSEHLLAGELSGLPLIVQGTSDPFGMPPAAAGRTVARVPGNHSLTTHLGAVAGAVSAWLALIVAQEPSVSGGRPGG